MGEMQREQNEHRMSDHKNPFDLLLEQFRVIVREEIKTAINGNGHADKLLTPAEAAALLNMSTKWLYRNAPKLPFTRKLGRKSLRFSHLGIQKYLAARINLN